MIMKTVTRALMLLISAGMLCACAGPYLGTIYSLKAKVVDAETGKPIQGAAAVAVWKGYEGDGVPVAVHLEESVSDSAGEIHIDGFWAPQIFESVGPVLSVYKCGYVLWNQKRIYGQKAPYGYRDDFDKENTVIRMEKWPADFSFVAHMDFIRYYSGYGYGAFGAMQFADAFHKCEAKKRSKEYYGK
jgi:hypothetical protein